MKKKLLFVIPSLALGGAEKSFVNLLNALDFEKYEADVFLFVKSGEFLPLLPKQVKILSISEDFATFSLPFLKSVFTFSKKGRLDLALYRLLFVLANTRARNASVSEQITWKYLKNFFPKIQGNYDATIGYLEKSSNYFISDRVSASQKIGWIHTDLKALDLDFAFEEKYLKKLDKIITVSENLVDKLQTYFPVIKDKFYCIENINSAKIINELANQPQDVILEDDEVFNIIFVGRLVKEKALHIAIEALELLLKKNINARLYLVGEGNKRPELQKMVQEKNIGEKVVFLGVQSNPYPLVKAAGLFLMTSVFEGKSIALEEAKILKKPIVITDFSTASEQITDGKTGLIAEMNALSVAEKIEKLYRDQDFKNEIINNLSQEKLGNEDEIEKLNSILNEKITSPDKIKLKTKLVYSFNRILKKLIKLKILETSESIDLLIHHEFSLARYGDGELNIMMGGNIHFQEYHPDLAKRLKQILLNYNDKTNLKIGIPLAINTVKEYKPVVKKFWNMNMDTGRFHWIKYCGIHKQYLNASLTRCYIDYLDKTKSKLWFENIILLWKDKKVLIVEGENSKLGVNNSLFSNAKSIDRVVTKSENAWDKYFDLFTDTLSRAGEYDIILASLGPTATILANDIAQKGFRIVDIGHLNLEYNKYIADYGENPGSLILEEETYHSQIIRKIL